MAHGGALPSATGWGGDVARDVALPERRQPLTSAPAACPTAAAASAAPPRRRSSLGTDRFSDHHRGAGFGGCPFLPSSEQVLVRRSHVPNRAQQLIWPVRYPHFSCDVAVKEAVGISEISETR